MCEAHFITFLHGGIFRFGCGSHHSHLKITVKRWNVKPYKRLHTILYFKFDAVPLLTLQNNAHTRQCQHPNWPSHNLHKHRPQRRETPTGSQTPQIASESVEGGGQYLTPRARRTPTNGVCVSAYVCICAFAQVRERNHTAHASTKQIAERQTAARFFTFGSSGLHIRALDTVPRRTYIRNRIR